MCLMIAELTPRRNANASIQCPVKEGSYVVEQVVALPKEIPQGESIAAQQVELLEARQGSPHPIS